jgi:hypothetical protein
MQPGSLHGNISSYQYGHLPSHSCGLLALRTTCQAAVQQPCVTDTVRYVQDSVTCEPGACGMLWP